ncbi:hypothetical protein BDV28DRAFT_88083 [Aspergillus coremiiformis]|uniref:DUF8035 domain-containing protein n=1 Tax=Aspergillus coremiiformis TaxID=138285 RepID=A0A5N6YTU9_9EURO|nr:hypothetical protein BDV28DRAFT_88083 [Aspergillus coremiiformis]
MSPTARYRPMSPSGSRMIDPMRASTGTVQLNSSYDASPSRSAYPSHSSSVPYVVTAYDSRYFREGGLEARHISSKTYRDADHSTKLRTEYAVRPRQRSSTTSVADTRLAPGRLHGPRAPPVITSSYRRSPSPLPSQEHHLTPSSSPRHHKRHPLSVSHIDYASDTGRLNPNDRAIRSPTVHTVYRGHDSNRHSRYPPMGGLRKGEDIDDYDAYSYTNPREQFEKDSAARLRYDRGSYRSERPLSWTGIGDHQLVRSPEPRASRPPPSTRGFDRLDSDPRVRRSIQGSADSDIDTASAYQRSRRRNPVSLHQVADEGYSSCRSDYEHTHRHSHRHRRHDGDRSSRQSYDDGGSRVTIATDSAPPGTSTGLGTAILGSGYDDHSQRAEHHHSHDHEHQERYARPRRPSRRRAEGDSDAYTSDEDLRKYRRDVTTPRKSCRSNDSTSGSDRPTQHLTVERHRRHRAHSRRRTQDSPTTKEANQPELVYRQEDKKSESTTLKDADSPPKGILKTPTDKFPEEPNPVREGVAPLKDAHKKGIPPGARWTKIDRRLVNPAALEAGRERFEERSDYVIVLRVLSKEEIQAYAVKTQEIRDARYHAYTQERRRRREEDRRRGRAVDDFSSDDEEDDDDLPLTIEDKPADAHRMVESAA